MSIDGSDLDLALSQSEALTREEVIRRRCRRVKQLSKLYRDFYWALMEEVRAKYREYYWVYGKSPFKEDEEDEQKQRPRDGVAVNDARSRNGAGVGDGVNRCAVGGCKAKAMALTRFCHPHILSDSRQKLYKGCAYVIKSAPTGPIVCGKPILRSVVPSLCSLHFQKAEKHVTRAIKKAGFSVASSTRPAPKLHVMIVEYVKEIQKKRRVAQKAKSVKVEIKEEETKC